MEDKYVETTPSRRQAKCPQCGDNIIVEMRAVKKEGRLYFWKDGLCKKCVNLFIDPFLTVTLVVDERFVRLLRN